MEKTYIVEFQFNTEEFTSTSRMEEDFKRLFPNWKEIRVKEKINI